MQNNEQIGSLKNKFQDFGAAPSDALWASISGEINEEKKRKGFFWWWTGIGVAASMLGGFFIYQSYFASPIQASEKKLLCTTKSTTNPLQMRFDSQVFVEENESLLTLEIAEESNYQQTQKLISEKVPTPDQNDFYDAGVIENTEVLVTEKEMPVHTNSSNDSKTPILKLPIHKPELLAYSLNKYPLLECRVSFEKPIKPWELGFRIGYYRSVFESDLADATAINNPNEMLDQTIYTGSLNSIGSANSFSGTATSKIGLDFTAGKYLSRRWMLNTGLNFTQTTFNSTFTAASVSTAESKITAIGLPIGFSYDLVQRGKFALRPSLAFVNELAVFERTTYDIGTLEKYHSAISGYSASIDFSLSAFVRLAPKMKLVIAPTYRRYVFQNVNASSLLSKRNNWMGGTLGLVWRL